MVKIKHICSLVNHMLYTDEEQSPQFMGSN